MRNCAYLLQKVWRLVWLLPCFGLIGAMGIAQQPVVAAAAGGALGGKLMRVEGVDAASGIQYVRFSVLGPVAQEGKAPPRFTLECTESGGKRGVNFLVTFGGVGPTSFTPPVHVEKGKPKPPKNPDVKLTMDFGGWNPMTRTWELLPSGELRYRNPGMHSPNMESPRVFVYYLSSLPELHVGYAAGQSAAARDAVFAIKPILDEMAKTPLCQR